MQEKGYIVFVTFSKQSYPQKVRRKNKSNPKLIKLLELKENNSFIN